MNSRSGMCSPERSGPSPYSPTRLPGQFQEDPGRALIVASNHDALVRRALGQGDVVGTEAGPGHALVPLLGEVLVPDPKVVALESLVVVLGDAASRELEQPEREVVVGGDADDVVGGQD